jgi:membrane fusion protein (multidrug efflux system)
MADTPQDKPDDRPEGAPAPGNDPPKKKKSLLERPILLLSIATAVVVVAVGGLLWWLHARHFESTDDAFIDAHIVRLAPQIAGRVTAVLVNDNQRVEPGQPIVVIDSADFKTRVAQAQAQRAQAQAQVDNAHAQIQVNLAAYQQSRADIAVAEAQATNAALDLARYQRLAALNQAAVAQQQFDQLQATARQTAAQRDAAVQASQMHSAQVAAARTLVASSEQQVEAAQAQLDDAGLNLGYARIDAPAAGHVTQMSVAVGDYIQPGTQILAIVPLQLWVTANFKETQLALMRVGQPATIEIDACPARIIRGHVDSIQRGAGQAFGILPPENATGNYVKVVQRVPVKILLDETVADCPLGPGMSVEPRVTVR